MALKRQTDRDEMRALAVSGRIEGEQEFAPVLLRYSTAGAGVRGFKSPTGDVATQIEGIVVASHMARAYWAEEYSGSNEPADCTSDDEGIKFGAGNPGGSCIFCPNNEWGTARRGKGKACRELRRLVIMAEGIGPVQYNVGPSSLENWDRYAQGLRANGLEYWQVRTRLGSRLQDAKGETTFTYSQIMPELLGELTLAEAKVIRDMRAEWFDALRRTALEPEGAETVEAEGIEI